jgi:predicted transcriptional regulator
MISHPLSFLGTLETAVMEYLWSHGSGDVAAVHRSIGQPRSITLNTVQSTLKRLHEKGLLTRDKVSHAFVYTPKMSREAFRLRLLDKVVAQVMQGEADAMLTAFVDLTERAGEEQLARLARLVAARRKASEEGRA